VALSASEGELAFKVLCDTFYFEMSDETENGLTQMTVCTSQIPRVAIVHEWVDAYAGSEQVFESLAEMFPSADLKALSYRPEVRLALGGRRVETTFLNWGPVRGRRSLTLPLMPLAWRALGKAKYDLVISSQHAFAHTNRLADGGVHLSYVHSPARYLWSPEIDSRGALHFLGPARSALRRIDVSASSRVTAYAANSTSVATRIERFWGREATVIHPPVRVEYFGARASAPPARDYVFGIGRWVPYKNLHLVIEAADVVGLPVKVAGRGPDKSRIVAAARAAKVPVELIESPSDEELRTLYRNAACLIFPTVEDFGIVPVEAQAAGTPVLALAEGGALDTIIDGVSGILVPNCNPHVLAEGVIRCMQLEGAQIAVTATRFGRDAFRGKIVRWVAANGG
jgi:glycosyltransferase involved in cell wall biosynthesis